MDSQTKSAEEAARKARLREARLQISGGSKYMKTMEIQFSGMSSREEESEEEGEEGRLECLAKEAPIKEEFFFFVLDLERERERGEIRWVCCVCNGREGGRWEIESGR